MSKITQPLLPISQLVKKAFSIYQERFLLISQIVVVNLPFAVITSLYSELYNRESFQRIASANPWGAGLVGLLLLLVGITGSLVALWAHLSVIFAIKERESTMTARQFLAMGWSRWKSGAWTYFLIVLFALLGFLALIIPGILLSVWFAFSLYIVAYEGLSGMAAIKRSRQLVIGRWWRVFYRHLVISVMMLAIVMLLSPISWLADVVNIFFCVPFAIIYGYLLYEDLKENTVQRLA